MTSDQPATLRTLMIIAAITLTVAWLSGCAGEAVEPESRSVAGGPPIPPPCPEDDGVATVTEPELRDELLAMQAEDQAELTADPGTDNSRKRTARLKEIIDEFGWPTTDVVGADGASAAWLIAQHSDLDPAFQEQALELMWQHVTDCRVDPTEWAYLHDRVAVANEEPQTFGTQLRCGEQGATTATPLVDESKVDEYREAVGMAPLAEYIAEFQSGCDASPS